MNDQKTCKGTNAEEFNSWLLLAEKVSTLTNSNPKDVCFQKAEENLLKFFTL